MLYELPFFRNDHGIKNVLMGGWRINDISTFRSGGSLTPGITLTNGGLTNRPFTVPGVSTNGPKTWKKGVTSPAWFNTAAYVLPSGTTGGVSNATQYYGYYGNAQNGTIRGPGQEIWNVSLFKEFHFRTNMLEFRAEAFNLLNHTNPNNPNTSIGNANMNLITGAYDPRIMEMALRYKF